VSALVGRVQAPLPWLGLLLLGPPGIAVAGYLTYSHFADQATVCAGIGSCAFVQTSEYSEIAGVPVALLGLLYFVAVPVLAFWRIRLGAEAAAWAAPVAVTGALTATAFVAYLTIVEIFVLQAICIWCVSLATLTVISLAVAVWAAARYG
jgi:uncharacterized membrane protein